MVFTHPERFHIADLRARKNLEKSTSWASKTLPGRPQDPPKSTPERPKTTKTDQKRERMQQEPQNATKNYPRGAQERKIAPTWLEHGLLNFSRWHGWAPLR